MLAQIGLAEVARALLAPYLFLAACSVLLMLALLLLLLVVLAVRAWNIHHDVPAPSFDRQQPCIEAPGSFEDPGCCPTRLARAD